MTGQIITYMHCDDGDHQKEVTSPNPRFTDKGDGTVTDNMTGLMLTKNSSITRGGFN